MSACWQTEDSPVPLLFRKPPGSRSPIVRLYRDETTCSKQCQIELVRDREQRRARGLASRKLQEKFSQPTPEVKETPSRLPIPPALECIRRST